MQLARTMRNGFTIIEMMVVILIIGVLMAALYPVVTGYQTRAKRSSTKVQIKRIQADIDNFYADVEEYPQSLDELVKEPGDERRDRWHGPYGETKDKKAPKDAFGFAYRYTLTPDAEHAYELISYGSSSGKSTPKKEWIDAWKI